MHLLSRLGIFVWERFPPFVYTAFSILYGAAIATVLGETSLISLRTAVIIVATLLLFFCLRLFDEIKDYEHDKHVYPNRPLPRGLLSLEEVFLILFVSLIGLFVLLLVNNGHPFAVACLFGYLFLMYQEFFIRTWLRTKITRYALLHTLVMIPFCVVLYVSDLNAGMVTDLISFLMFSAGSWTAFSAFEFVRKTYATKEERPGVRSYSERFARGGAVALSCAMLVTTLALYAGLYEIRELITLCLGVSTSVLLGVWYAIGDRSVIAMLYRGMVLFVLALMYILILLNRYQP